MCCEKSQHIFFVPWFGVVRVPPARIILDVMKSHDRRCRSSVVGYLETCTSGTLTPWLSIDWAWCRFVGAGYHVVWVGYVALLWRAVRFANRFLPVLVQRGAFCHICCRHHWLKVWIWKALMLQDLITRLKAPTNRNLRSHASGEPAMLNVELCEPVCMRHIRE